MEGLTRSEGHLKLRIVAFFICFLLFVAAIDTIPDPYALKPPTEHASSSIVLAHTLPANRAPIRSLWIIAARTFQMYRVKWLSRRFALDLLPQGDLPLPRVHHAADSSPPVIA